MLIFKQKHRSVTHSWSRRPSPLAQPPSSFSAPPAHTSVRSKKLTLYKLITDVSKLKRVSSRRWYDQRHKHLFWQPMTVIGSSSCRQRENQQIIKKEKPVPLWEGGLLKFLTLFSSPGSRDKCVTSCHLTRWSWTTLAFPVNSAWTYERKSCWEIDGPAYWFNLNFPCFQKQARQNRHTNLLEGFWIHLHPFLLLKDYIGKHFHVQKLIPNNCTFVLW